MYSATSFIHHSARGGTIVAIVNKISYSRSNLNSSVNFKAYLVIGNLSMIETNCYNLIHKGLSMIGSSFVKYVSTDCTLILILSGNFLLSKFGRLKNIAIFAKTQRI